LNGRDVRALPLLERKGRLRAVMPRVESRVLYLDHVAERGVELYEAACRRDLERVVAKWTRGAYQCDAATSWLKIKNPAYSQMDGRRDLFEARRDERQRHREQRAPELPSRG
jgi:ATP-dependent DNA ligase